MITLKLWNSLTAETRKHIIEIADGAEYVKLRKQLIEKPYHHNFDYDTNGMILKSILECCNLQKNGSINITVSITPEYAPVEKPQPKAPKINKEKAQKLEYAKKLRAGYASGISVFDEVVKKYGGFKIRGEWQKNYRITDIGYGNNKKLKQKEPYIGVDWVGSHTDGYASEWLSEIRRQINVRGEYIMPAEMEQDNHGYTRYRRYDICIDKDAMVDMFNKIAEELEK